MVFDRSNLPYWLFLGTGISLFLCVINAGGGDDDLDSDADIRILGEEDIDLDAELDGISLDWLGWMGVGRAPLILLLATDLSLWGAIGWMLNVAIAENPFVLFVSFFAALISGSRIARPLGKVFASFGESAKSDRLVGCTGTVSSAAIYRKHRNMIGQIDVIDSAKALVTINAVLPNWATKTPRYGESVLIIEHEAQHYLVIASDSIDCDRWFEHATTKKHR